MKASKIAFLKPARERTDVMTDEGLVAACGMVDEAALGEIFRRFRKDVYRFLARMSGCDDRDLDDLVQETFIRVQRGARRFAARSSVKGWILGIASNVVKNHFRTEMRRKATQRAFGDARGGSTGAAPSDLAETREQIARMRNALDGLSHDHREVFILCALEGVSGADAARVLGVRPGTVWRRLHEARRELTEAMGRKQS